MYILRQLIIDQDVVDTLWKKNFPDLQPLYRKSDKTGYYAGNSVSEIEYSLCKKYDINLLWPDYNEPQCGRGQANRDSALLKSF